MGVLPSFFGDSFTIGTDGKFDASIGISGISGASARRMEGPRDCPPGIYRAFLHDDKERRQGAIVTIRSHGFKPHNHNHEYGMGLSMKGDRGSPSHYQFTVEDNNLLQVNNNDIINGPNIDNNNNRNGNGENNNRVNNNNNGGNNNGGGLGLSYPRLDFAHRDPVVQNDSAPTRKDAENFFLLANLTLRCVDGEYVPIHSRYPSEEFIYLDQASRKLTRERYPESQQSQSSLSNLSSFLSASSYPWLTRFKRDDHIDAPTLSQKIGTGFQRVGTKAYNALPSLPSLPFGCQAEADDVVMEGEFRRREQEEKEEEKKQGDKEEEEKQGDGDHQDEMMMRPEPIFEANRNTMSVGHSAKVAKVLDNLDVVSLLDVDKDSQASAIERFVLSNESWSSEAWMEYVGKVSLA